MAIIGKSSPMLIGHLVAGDPCPDRVDGNAIPFCQISGAACVANNVSVCFHSRTMPQNKMQCKTKKMRFVFDTEIAFCMMAVTKQLEPTMSHTPLTWHTRPAARALIGLIAASGIDPTNRPRRDNLSADYAPIYHDALVYDCDEFNQLAVMQQQALDAALKAAWAAPNMACHTKDNPAYADWYTLVDQDLAALVAGEIAALRKSRENNGADGHCLHCGRDNRGHEHEPCSDDCPYEELLNARRLAA